MAVGFFDYDIILKPKKLYLNLEAMKIASYHNKRGTNVVLTDNLNDYSKFEEFYICKNIMPQNFRATTFKTIKSPNTQYLGLAFSGGEYISMDETFEKQIAYPQLYAPYFRQSLQNHGLTITSLEKLLNSHFVRLKMGGNTLDISKLSRKEKMYIYDFEIEEVPEWEQKLHYACKELTNKSRSNPLTFQNGLKVTSFENIRKLSAIKGISAKNIHLFHEETYTTFKQEFESIKEWVSSRDGVNHYFGVNTNPNSLREVMKELCLCINKYYCVLSNLKAWHFVVSPNCDSSLLNKVQKEFQYWTEVRVDVTFQDYLKARNARDYNRIMDIVNQAPHGKLFKELIMFSKSDIKRRGWYYHAE
jgi:hypothetical protein